MQSYFKAASIKANSHITQMTSGRSSNIYRCVLSSEIQLSSDSARTVSSIDQFDCCFSFHFWHEYASCTAHVIIIMVQVSISRQRHWMCRPFSLWNLIKFIVFPFLRWLFSFQRYDAILSFLFVFCQQKKTRRFFILFYLWPKRIIVRKPQFTQIKCSLLLVHCDKSDSVK